MSATAIREERGFTAAQYFVCLRGIVWREALRFVHQRERFISALVRPLVWLFIFAAGFRQILGVSIIPPYDTYVLYEVYVTPGLMAMIQLFNGMQSSLSMVYDREMGNMRMLLVSPFPRWYLLIGKLLASTAVSVLQVYAYLVVAWLWGITPPAWGYLAVLPALVLSGMMLGALGMLLSSAIRQLENFAGVMNFVIFPMFFASSALYPLWLVQQSSPVVYTICRLNPFTYAIELIRFALYFRIEWTSLAVVAGMTGTVHRWRDPRLRSRAGPDRAARRGWRVSARALFKLTLAIALLATAAAEAAPPGPRDPDWPCQQIKVPELSLAAVWSGPPVDTRQTDWQRDQTVADLAHRLAQRRIPIDQAATEIRAFAERAGAEKRQRVLTLLAGLFNVLNQERESVIAGLDRFGHRQKELAENLRADNDKLSAMQHDAGADPAAVDKLTQQVTWEMKVFQDRREAIGYACDVPAAIEQRLFGLARTIQQVVE